MKQTKEELNERRRAYYHANRDEILKKNKIRLKSPKGKELTKKYTQTYYHKNREKILEKKIEAEKVRQQEGYYLKPEHKYVRRNARYKREYNITAEDYDKMFKEQEGCCKICNTHLSELKIRLCVDHCHTTGKVRALLCSSCNSGIGALKESVENLKSAIAYLEFYK